ncbi:MAG: nucleotidyltransferase domain-containing protein, partial [Saprospiraceae bacterium]
MNLDPIIEYLHADTRISFAYIFGSVLTPYFIQGKSDIDIAILGDRPFDFTELVEISDGISDLLPDHPEIDLIDLMTDAPVLIHEIIEHGNPLFMKNILTHDEFVCTQWSRFIDHQMWVKQFDDELKNGVFNNINP